MNAKNFIGALLCVIVFVTVFAVSDGAGHFFNVVGLLIVVAGTCGAALLSYCVWAFETAATATSDFPFYELSIVPMLTAMFRYLLILDEGRGGAPEDVFLADRTLQVLGAVWIVVYGVAVYAA